MSLSGINRGNPKDFNGVNQMVATLISPVKSRYNTSIKSIVLDHGIPELARINTPAALASQSPR